MANAAALGKNIANWFIDSSKVALETWRRAAQKEVLRAAQVSSKETGVQPAIETIVDGRVGKKIEQATSEVVVNFDYSREVVKLTVDQLRGRRSPSGSGKYKRDLMIFANGVEISGLAQIPYGAEIVVVMVAPYARRLEVGKRADGKPFVSEVAPNIVEDVAKRIIGPRWRKLATVIFGYVDVSGTSPSGESLPYVLKGRLNGTKYLASNAKVKTRQPGKDRGAGKPLRYPAVVIKGKNP